MPLRVVCPSGLRGRLDSSRHHQGFLGSYLIGVRTFPTVKNILTKRSHYDHQQTHQQAANDNPAAHPLGA